MKVLLTGATGFIGRRLLARLVDESNEVCVLALPDTVKDLVQTKQVRVVVGSLSDREVLARAARHIDVVVHLAAKVTGLALNEFRVVNVEGTSHLLDASVQARVKRFVYMSSTAVYGLAPFLVMWPIAEDSPLAAHGSRGLRLYGWSKIEAEKAVVRAHEASGMDYVILRPTVVYGRGAVGAERLLSLLMQFPQRMRFEIAPNGVIQWIHVSDLVELTIRAIGDRAAVNQVFNAAGATANSLPEVSAALRSVLGQFWQFPVPTWMPPAPLVAPFAIDKARQLLRFSPRVRIRDGLAEMFGRRAGGGPGQRENGVVSPALFGVRCDRG
jgi:UDP-glucose 4-epimerase